MIKIGSSTSDMRNIHVYINGFSEGYFPEDSTLQGPSGFLHVHSGIIPRAYRGVIEIREHEPAVGFANLAFLQNVWLTKGHVYYQDGEGINVPVIWLSAFEIIWDRQDANIGTLTYELREVFL